jgi:hypothetical protein
MHQKRKAPKALIPAQRGSSVFDHVEHHWPGVPEVLALGGRNRFTAA